MLRLAGLLHDAGHGFLSHVSERAMSRIVSLPHGGSASDARREAETHFKCRKTPSFSEVLASLIVLLPEFIELLRIANVPYWPDATTLANNLAHLIVGSTTFRARPFLSEIISGSVDADKLDYMARDCFLAGLPMPVDVERLLQKMQAVAIPADSEPGSSWAKFSGLSANQPIYVMALDERGGIAAEELVVSRVLLYDKLYHHQKVRSFEGLAERAIDLLIAGHEAFRSPGIYLKLTDADFLEGRWPDGPTTDDVVNRARGLISRIDNRHEMVRAIAFGPAMIQSPADDPIPWIELKPFVARERSEYSNDFVSRIVDRARNYLTAAGQAASADTLTSDVVIVDLPDPQGISQKTRFLVGSERTGVRNYSEVARVDRWAEAYENEKSVGYVYAPPEHAIAIHLAVRSVVEEISGIVFDDRQLTLTKVDREKLLELADLVAERGERVAAMAMGAAPQSIVPIADRDELEEKYGTIIGELAERFQTYQPFEGAAIDAAFLIDWLLQFSRDDVPLIITVLQHVQFWTRQRLADALRSFLERIQDKYETIQLLPLGGPTTSAQHLQYLIDDIRPTVKIQLNVLRSPEECVSGIPVVLYDDYVGSGGQSCTVMQQWYGAAREDWILREKHVEPLSARARGNLAKCEIICVFAAGRRSGLERLRIFAGDLIGVTIAGWIVQPQELSCFRLAANVFPTLDEAQRAERAFANAGRRALEDQEWDDEKKRSRSLGYGGNADLNVFYYNTPSSTLTALWKKGEAEGSGWLPLFIRRKRAEPLNRAAPGTTTEDV
jgi:HD superfamily phosphohydrolase